MATKKNKLGFDPLSWMQDAPDSESTAEQKEKPAKKSGGEKRARKTAAFKSNKMFWA